VIPDREERLNPGPGTRDPGPVISPALALSRWTALPWPALVLPAASGLLLGFAFIDFSLYPLAWVAFVPLLWRLAGVETRREAIVAGAVAGLAGVVPAFFWLVYTMQIFGGFPYPIALFFYACLSAYQAGQFVLFAAAVRYLGWGPLALAVPTAWVALEFLYPNLFPWRVANTQFHVPVLTQVGDLTGPFGLSFVIVWLNAAIVLALRVPRRWKALLGAGVGVAAVVAYGLVRMPAIQAAIDAAPAVRVGLVQANISIYEKENVALFDINVDRYRRLSDPLQREVDLLVWPESVAQWWVPAGIRTLDEKDNPFPGVETFLIYGGLAFTLHPGEPGRRRADKYNSAFLIDPQGNVLGRYDKHVLMPFGEYLPGASLFPQLAALSPQTGDFTPGSRLVTLDVPGLVRVAPLICYEDVPAHIAREMTRMGAEALLTIFNDAWFGRSVAPYQHEALALWRAIENRRYFMRVGNAGVTGIVDPLGRVSARLGQFTEEVLQAEIRPLRLQTFYTRYGDVFAWATVLATAILLAARRARATHRRA
jgi:apolipoprotein N-acyltransferase